jgi:Arylsulfotransferase (ASST)
VKKRLGRRELLATGGGVALTAGLALVGNATESSADTTTTEVSTTTVGTTATIDTTTTTSPPTSTVSSQPFVSRADLRPPPITFASEAGWNAGASLAEGYYLVAPKAYSKNAPNEQGLMILDAFGHLVWYRQSPEGVVSSDLQVQTYRGRPVLTWWEGKSISGHGQGTGYVANERYQVIATVQAVGAGLLADSHELCLTPRNTALITVFRTAPADLSSVGGSANGYVFAGQVQEIDLATGRLVFSWDSLSHVNLAESYSPLSGGTQAQPYDYFHINSVAPTPDGNFIISARNTWALYKVSRRTGAIMWRLGGKKSNFRRGPGTHFYWQHHARLVTPSLLTVFDDGASPPKEPWSRGLVLRLNERARSVSLVRAYAHPSRLRAANQGSVQYLKDGRVVVGWGNQPYFSEFLKNGTLVVDARFPADLQSYRAFRSPWTGLPVTRPAAAARTYASSVNVYASWNGDTRTAKWRVLAGPSASSLTATALAPRTGFETAIAVRPSGPYFAVEALDAKGRVLGRSSVVQST